jgi:hypothetical protein
MGGLNPNKLGRPLMSVAMPAADDRPFAAPPDPAAAGSGSARLRQEGLTDFERNYAMATHLSLFATILVLPPAGCVAPIILWLLRRERSGFIDDHGRELTNVVITGAILSVLWFIPFIGWAAIGFWYICTAIAVIRGAVASSRGEYFRYPMTMRFVS